MLTMIHINKIVAKEFNITSKQLMSKNMKKNIATARHVSMWFCHRELGWSSLVLCREFHKLSHSTTLGSLKRAQNIMDTEPAFRLKILNIEAGIIQKKVLLQEDKQRYNLNYRLREKELRINTQQKTVSLIAEDEYKIDSGQLKKLLKNHGYSIQYSID